MREVSKISHLSFRVWTYHCFFKRCFRQKKPCLPSDLKRKPKPRKSTTSKTAQLEEKLNDIVSLLKSAKQSEGIAANANPDRDLMRNSDLEVAESSVPEFRGNSELGTPVSHGRRNHVFSQSETVLDRSPRFSEDHETCEASEYQAQEGLSVFRTQMLPYFPVVHIPSQISAKELRERRPFLWDCIMACTVKPIGQQIAFSRRIKEVLARKTLFDCDKDIDLLIGLLIYISW